jgi:4-diphosphocytidyl-2-C-methyl-D-erythritol kinase
MPIYHTSPPAKLNLFLEILGRRDDGFHELDTVMIAIDWRDELQLQMTVEPGIELRVDWLPSRAAVAEELRVQTNDPILDVPTDGSNLVYRALKLVNEATGYQGGWRVELSKRIPSGAGMGGASSDAAATLRLAAAALADAAPELAERLTNEKIERLAASLGSDVPFFLGNLKDGEATSATPELKRSPTGTLARALGRGERLTFYDLPREHRFIVVFPGIALSTAAVYGRATVTEHPQSGRNAIERFIRRDPHTTANNLYNALTRPACGLSPLIGEALECLRQSKPPHPPLQSHGILCQTTGDTFCQMTGSGSACFIWLTTNQLPSDDDCGWAKATEAWIATIRDSLPGGALVQAVATCPAAPEIHIM